MEPNNNFETTQADIEAAKALLFFKYGDSYYTIEDSIEKDLFLYLKNNPLTTAPAQSKINGTTVRNLPMYSPYGSTVEFVSNGRYNSSFNGKRPRRRVVKAKRLSLPLSVRKTSVSDESLSDEIDNQQERGAQADMITLRPNGSQISKNAYNSINWEKESKATRALLRYFFSRGILATHTLSGMPSPAFYYDDLPRKGKLDPLIVGDIIYAVTEKCGVPASDVRHSITITCADECKLSKIRRRKEMRKTKETPSGVL